MTLARDNLTNSIVNIFDNVSATTPNKNVDKVAKMKRAHHRMSLPDAIQGSFR